MSKSLYLTTKLWDTTEKDLGPDNMKELSIVNVAGILD